MQEFVLKESVLNDDTVYIANEGKIFKNGYVAVLEFYTYANEWSNHKHVKSFRKMSSLYKYIDKNYPEFDDEIYQYNENNGGK